MTALAANRRGMLALTFAMAAYAVNDTFVKLVARDLPVGETIVLRGVLSVVFLVTAVAIAGGFQKIAAAFTPLVLLRALFDALGTVFFISALVQMKIAELSAIILTSPLIMTAISAFAFRDVVGWRRWCAIGVGLMGTLFIVKPSATTVDVWALLGLTAALCAAGRDLTTRRIDPEISTLVVSIYGAVAVMLSGLAVGTTEIWHLPTIRQWLEITVAAFFLGIGTYLVVMAFRSVDIPAVAPFRYTLLIWMSVCGYIAFGEIPDGWSLFGAALIVASGLYALHREVVRRRDLTARAVPPA